MFATNIAFSQIATNFVANDCSGTSHELFADLNAGKVVVMCWVMPCGSCSGPALTAWNMVKSYQTSNPGKVIFYMVDDYANTSCSNLASWASSNNLSGTTMFSNAAIKMSDYGSAGMPKTIVVGGGARRVFLNENNSLNSANLQTAINNALLATSSTEIVKDAGINAVSIYPNPAVDLASVYFKVSKVSDIKIEVFNQLGKKVLENVYQNQSGDVRLDINTSTLREGVYFVKVGEGENRKVMKLVISR